MHSVHLVFHVSILEPATLNKIPHWIQTPPPLIEIEGKPEYKIAEIADSKINRRHSCKLLYLICWLSYEGTEEEFFWLLATKLEHAAELVAEFHSAHPTK